MPGLMIWLIMNALKKSKPNNIHYVPRDYEAVRNQGRENSTKLPLPKNTVKEKTPYGYWYCKPGASRKKCCSISMAAGLTAAARSTPSI